MERYRSGGGGWQGQAPLVVPSKLEALALGFQLLSQRAYSGLSKGPEEDIKGVISKGQCFLEAKNSLSSKTDGWRVEVKAGGLRKRGAGHPGLAVITLQVEAGVGTWGVLPKTWGPGGVAWRICPKPSFCFKNVDGARVQAQGSLFDAVPT